jgi:hypothetical protein
LRPVRVLVLASWAIATAVVATVIFSAPAVRREFSHSLDVASVCMVVALFAAIASVPWVYAYGRARTPEREGGAMAIALISLGALALLIPAGSAPAEGLGYYVLFYLLAVWSTFAVVAARG